MLKEIITSFLLTVICFGTYADREWENKQIFEVNREPMRTTFSHYTTLQPAMTYGAPTDLMKSLNGIWKFNYAHTWAEVPQDFYKESFDVSHWSDIQVPGPWEMQGFGTPIYTNTEYPFKKDPPYIKPIFNNGTPIGSYRTDFIVPSEWDGREIFIHLGGVSSAYYLWINEQKTGYAEDSYLPSEFNITPFIKKGKNIVSLQVYRWSDGAYLEDQDGWRFSGISRDIYIYSTPKIYLRDVAVKTDLDAQYKDAGLRVETDIKNLSGKSVSGYTVETILLDGKNEITKMIVKSGKITNGQSSTIVLSSQLKNPKKWTGETPNLYTMVVVLKDSRGNVVDVMNSRIGFRKMEIRDRVFYLNGQPVKMRGVNRVAHDTFTGKYITPERTLREVKVMKMNNINSVRTSHMPAEEYFYELCDEYGIMVIGEANVETHGFGYGAESLAHDSEWTDAHVSRITRMIERDKNHACVVQWSLGNEAGNGINFRAMYLAAKQLDSSRPIQYHFDNEPISSDILGGGIQRNGQKNPSGRYLTLEDLQVVLASSDTRPFLMNEFAHAMGNGMGNLKEYMDLIEYNDVLTGAMIWDWNDQSITRNIANPKEYGMLIKDQRFATNECKRPHGAYQWFYGGDFGDQPNSGNFSNNGIVQPDLSNNPKLAEVRKVYQNIDIRNFNPVTGDVEIFNKYYFIGISDLNLHWEVLENGVSIKREIYGKVEVAPRTTMKIKIPIETVSMKSDKEYIVHLFFLSSKPVLWAESGYCVAWQQFIMKPWDFAKQINSFEKSTPEVLENSIILKLKSSWYEMIFDKSKGKLTEVTLNGIQVVRSGPELSFWRAPIDNDGTGRNARYENGQLTDGRGGRLTRLWDAAGYPNMPTEVKSFSFKKEIDGVIVKIEKFMRSKIENSGFEVMEIYRINNNGQILLSSDINPVGNLPEVARVGYEVEIPENFSQFSWYGRGPMEGYIDRHDGTAFGLYEGSVEEQFYNYIYPQETGNKYDVRWAKIADISGSGIEVSGGMPFQVAVRKYTNMNIAEAGHPDKLTKLKYTILNINHLMAPIGNESCGPRPIDAYVLYPKQWKFEILFKF